VFRAVRGVARPDPRPDRHAGSVQRYVDRGAGLRLWAEEVGAADGPALLLVAPANQASTSWPDEFVGPLAARHRVIRYDHRDTGRSTGPEPDPGDDGGGGDGDEDDEYVDYGAVELAEDAVAVLDAFGVGRAHVLGMGLGGLLTQLLMLDHPDRLASAVLVCSTALSAPDDPVLPPPDPALRRLWAEVDDPRDEQGELDWRVEHWRLLDGGGHPFDEAGFRALEERAVAHRGKPDPVTTHSRLDLGGLDRGAELAGSTVPALVVEASADPVHPPPHAAHLAAAIGPHGARLVRIDAMGHSISRATAPALAAAVLSHTIG
jgi:pimeloyl-ACP methyl ester carboxylesterase